MKTLSNLMEAFDSNPGNKLGVTNHLTPIFNIITNVRNFFGAQLGIIVEAGEDGVSIKLHSSKFVNPDEINKLLDENIYPSSGVKCSLRNYIISQGLDTVKLVNLGMYYIVYFCPSDIRTKENPDACCCKCPKCTCKEQLEYNLNECELDIIYLNEDDQELEDKSKEEMLKIIDSTDKVKAANKLAEKVAEEIELPKEYYFKAVTDSDGNNSIALRYKTEKRRPFGKKADVVVSLLNIYKSGDEAVWVDAFLNKDKNPDEMNTLIENILKFIGAVATDDDCVYAIPSDESNKNDDDKSKADSNDNNKDSNENTVDNSETNDGTKSDEVSGTLNTDDKNNN